MADDEELPVLVKVELILSSCLLLSLEVEYIGLLNFFNEISIL